MEINQIINLENGFVYEKDIMERDSGNNEYKILLKHLGNIYLTLRYSDEEERDKDFDKIDTKLKSKYKDLIFTR